VVILHCVGAVLGFFGLAAIAWMVRLFVLDGRLYRTALERLAGMACPSCGAPVGAATASAARTDQQERARRAHEHAGENNWMLRRRVDTSWRFDCPACGAALAFDPSGTQLLVTPPDVPSVCAENDSTTDRSPRS
jgi:hypothetical protein